MFYLCFRESFYNFKQVVLENYVLNYNDKRDQIREILDQILIEICERTGEPCGEEIRM